MAAFASDFTGNEIHVGMAIVDYEFEFEEEERFHFKCFVHYWLSIVWVSALQISIQLL